MSLHTNLRRDERNLTLAIWQAVYMWSNSKYTQFLRQDKPAQLDKDWFKWFVVDWRVARTIKMGKRESVRNYLDTNFRVKLKGKISAKDVDDAAQYIREQRWGATERKDGSGSSPISVVSKIGFLFSPHNLVPYDKYSRGGLNKLRKSTKQDGDSHIETEVYCDYLSAFDCQFANVHGQIRNALAQRWVADVANKLGCPVETLVSASLQRKVFDNYLMAIGGQKPAA